MDDHSQEIDIQGSVQGGNANVGGTQHFYGTVNIQPSSTVPAPAGRQMRVFISYRRADARAFAERLHDDLEKAGTSSNSVATWRWR